MAAARAGLGAGRVTAPPQTGSLALVGLGITAGAHLTSEARTELERADDVLYLATDSVTASWLARLRPGSRSLDGLYEPGVPRERIYDAIADAILEPARAGRRVCAALYGHPGVLSRPAHVALRLAREEGIPARLLPAVSALDCLFADLGVDPADTGLQTYDATEFLLHGRRPDPTAALVLWQLSVIGKHDWSPEPDYGGVAVLVAYLGRWYPAEHEVVAYEASPYAGVEQARIERVALGDLPRTKLTPMSTLYVPPSERPAVDETVAERLWPRRA